VGKQIQSRPPSVVLEHTRIASVLRGTTVLLARPDTILQPGDRLLIVVQPEAIKELGQYLGPPSPVPISTHEAKVS
jgi:Trk K+ transport system NAD-binding subunit